MTMTDFPTLSYTSASKFPNSFIYLKPKKGNPSGEASSEGHHRDPPPPPPPTGRVKKKKKKKKKH